MEWWYDRGISEHSNGLDYCAYYGPVGNESDSMLCCLYKLETFKLPFIFVSFTEIRVWKSRHDNCDTNMKLNIKRSCNAMVKD